MPGIAILGSTGSIGTQTLDVINQLHDYSVVALSVHSNINLLEKQIAAYKPSYVHVFNKEKATDLVGRVNIPVLTGEEALVDLVTRPDVDIVVVSVVGSIGLKPTLAALQAGKKVALANKETLVVGGHLVMDYASQIIPIDSEHSALWQCFDGKNIADVAKIILTASGGPFRNLRRPLESVTVEQALNHPRWKMGGKISVDSATLMNKGLEVIEAHWLFGFAYDDIEVIVHPESIIHSMIRFRDSSILAQMAVTDMRLPIQYALTYPTMRPFSRHLDLVEVGCLTFEAPDLARFPSLTLAYEAGKQGGIMPTVMNAANEVAVSRFLEGKIPFVDIPKCVSAVMEQTQNLSLEPSLEAVLQADIEARSRAEEQIEKRRQCL